MQSSRHLLVVEDDVAVARALSRTLARRGFAVAVARSCVAARALGQRFDVAILDLDLPDGNGVDLARDLRVPTILFFTGSTDLALLARARRLGTVIMKSAGTSELLALLNQESAAGGGSTKPNGPEPQGAFASRAVGNSEHRSIIVAAQVARPLAQRA